MDWDAVSYSDAEPPCLRRLDTGKHYPEDAGAGVHADGEIWSQYLWAVRARLGADEVARTDNVRRVLLTSHELLTPDANFADAVAALRTAAAALQPAAPAGSTWVDIVEQEARRTGFLPSSPG